MRPSTCRDGTEHLLLQIVVDEKLADEQVSRLVWVTPVPAPAAAVRAGILRGFPRFRGVQPAKYLASSAREVLLLMSAPQIWTLPIVGLGLLLRSGDSNREEAILHQRMVRDGVELELISAESRAALADHLTRLGLTLPDSALQSLAARAAGCFAVVRVVDPAAYRAATEGSTRLLSSLGIELSFPAQQGFFPLVASSALPGDHVEVVVTVLGFAQALEKPPAGLVTEHYLGDLEGSAEALQLLGLDSRTNLRESVRYTRFKLTGAPRTWQSDLRFGPGAPRLQQAAASWLANPGSRWLGLILALVAYLCVSMLATWCARPVWPPPSRPSGREAAAMGLANLLSVVGVLVVARQFARRRGLSSKTALKFTAASSALFFLLLIVLAVPTHLLH